MVTFWTDQDGLAELISDLRNYRNPMGFTIKIKTYVPAGSKHSIRVKLTRGQVKHLMKTVDIRERYER